MNAQRPGLITLPNAISTGRAIIAWIAIASIWHCVANGLVASASFWLCMFVLAVALDALDGWVARKLGIKSSLGSYVDIFMDRLTEYPAWILLSYLDPSLRALIVIVVVRNILVDGVKFEAAYKGIAMEAGVPKMIAPAELLVNHPVSKTAYNVIKILAIVLSLGCMIFSKKLHLVAIVLLAAHTLFCALRGFGSILEMRSIWLTAPCRNTQRAIVRYIVQCTVGLIVLGVILGGYLH